ncbi:MAG: O-antigen ligase family protein, partial [Thermoanaerobaculia bacterium]
AQVVIGVAQWLSRSHTLWGVALADTGTRLRGSFVNPNHLALFLEIAVAVAAAWAWWAVRRAALEGGHAESRILTVGPPALVFLLLLGGLVLTGSRAALLSALAAMSAQGMVVGSRRGRKWLLAAGLVVGLGGVAAIAALGAEGTFSRLAASSVDELSGGYRVEAALATFDLFQRFPIAGSGLGSFQAAFPLVQPPIIPGFWRHAHADWIEYLATTGILGAALLGGGLFFYGKRLRQVVLHGERSEGRAAGLAALGALVAVAIHSFADFGLTIPANAFALAVVAGAAGATRIVPPAPSPD